jgi:hypothetical protein
MNQKNPTLSPLSTIVPGGTVWHRYKRQRNCIKPPLVQMIYVQVTDLSMPDAKRDKFFTYPETKHQQQTFRKHKEWYNKFYTKTNM